MNSRYPLACVSTLLRRLFRRTEREPGDGDFPAPVSWESPKATASPPRKDLARQHAAREPAEEDGSLGWSGLNV
jgi:hypothetical protein